MNRARWLAGGWIALALLAALGAARLRFDVEVLNLLPADLPVVRGLKLYQENFSNARELILTVRAPEPAAAEAAARALAAALRAQTNLTAEVHWQPPWLEAPGEAVELSAYLWFNQPPEVFRDYAQRLAPGRLPEELAAARDALALSLSPADIARRAYDPLDLTATPPALADSAALGGAAGQFASGDGRFRLVFLQARGELRGYPECEALLQAVRATEAKLRADDAIGADVRVRYTGRPAFVAEIAGGMERDMIQSVLGTLALVAGMFWLAHRRWQPLLWLVVLLSVVLGATTALGGLIFGAVSVVSMGFAAILLGLAADYALVLYQEWRAEPGRAVAEVRREHTSAIAWSAATTAGAFAMLNFGGLPGLGQLGTLVAVGTVVAAAVMLTSYLPPLARVMRSSRGNESPSAMGTNVQRSTLNVERSKLGVGSFARVTTTALIFVSILVLIFRPPGFDHSADALRPRHSSAYAALEELTAELGRTREPLWLLTPGADEAEVAARLARAQAILDRHVTSNSLGTAFVPTAMWPDPAAQAANRALLRDLVARRAEIQSAILAAGFTTNALSLTGNMFDTWARAADAPGAFWPTNAASRWAFNQFTTHTAGGWLALGLLHPPEVLAANDATRRTRLVALADDLARDGVLLSGWELMGHTIFERVARDFWFVLGPMALVIAGGAWLAFRSWREVLLCAATLAFALLLLAAVMGACGWSWNLMNLMALPLLLGAGIDYSLHVQLALRRHSGDAARVRATTGKALWLCAGTTCAAFGTLAWSGNAGLASLGQVCAAGVACAAITANVLLPAWWQWLVRPASKRVGTLWGQRAFPSPPSDGGEGRVRGTGQLSVGRASPGFKSSACSSDPLTLILSPKGERKTLTPPRCPDALETPSPLPEQTGEEVSRRGRLLDKTQAGAPVPLPPAALTAPSRFYGDLGWRAALGVARLLPACVVTASSRFSLGCYWHLARARREVVIANLLPVVGDDRARATAAARRLFDEFARKLADLWRYESGASLGGGAGAMSGVEHLEAARAGGRGVLLVTPHLGNWELGAPLLAARGVPLLVITLVEPGRGLTELRRASRARHGIETLVIGADPFAFVEVIKRLEAGAVVALLVDRPAAASAVEVALFGRPFAASIAPAELARASGCAVVPVTVTRGVEGYAARALPAMVYDRRALGDRAARIAFTQEILRAFEPLIRQHPEQWFHFVPVWPRA